MAEGEGGRRSKKEEGREGGEGGGEEEGKRVRSRFYLDQI